MSKRKCPANGWVYLVVVIPLVASATEGQIKYLWYKRERSAKATLVKYRLLGWPCMFVDFNKIDNRTQSFNGF